MPLFSEHISNMYYGSSSPYSSPYSSYSSVTPHGSSYSASYLNPGGSYSTHSSLGYSRPSPVPRSSPVSSRWVTSSGRNYAPMLSTITERGTASPVRINSPRRIPYTNRVYATPSYTPRPININTADIDVSKDKYRNKHEDVEPTPPTPEPENEGPFMPRVDGKPETGIDSSPGIQRSTIRRGRTVVRLHTVKRKDRNSPRESQSELTQDQAGEANNITENVEQNEPIIGWREKLSEDLAYKDKKEKKTIGAKLVEKFIVKDKDSDSDGSYKERKKKTENVEAVNNLATSPLPISTSAYSRSPDRRCSIEMLAEQAQVLDTLIRGENLSIARLDLSKVGICEQGDTQRQPSVKRRKSNNEVNPLQTTKSDNALHQNLKFKDAKNFSKKRSIQKSSSGGSICRLDSITEFPKVDQITSDLPAIEEVRTSIKRSSIKQKPKPKLKPVITSSVEVSPPMSPLKFKVDVTVEEKPMTPKTPKKEIIYSSVIEDVEPIKNTEQSSEIIPKPDRGPRKYTKKKTKTLIVESGNESPEPDDGNFWDKIGKRETVYLIKRKQIIDETLEKNRRAFFWFPEDEEAEVSNEVGTSQDNNLLSDSSMAKNKTEMLSTSEININKEEIKQLNANEIEQILPGITKSDITKKISNEELNVKSEPNVIIPQDMSPMKIMSKVDVVKDVKEVHLPDAILSQSATVTEKKRDLPQIAPESKTLNENEKYLPQMTPENKTVSDSSDDKEKIITQESKSNINSETDKYNKQTVIIPINNLLLSKNTLEPEVDHTKKDDETTCDTCPSCGGKVEELTIDKSTEGILTKLDEKLIKSSTENQVKSVIDVNKIKLPDKSIPEINKTNNKVEKKVTPPGKALVKGKKPTDPKVAVKDKQLSGKSSSDKTNKSSPEKKPTLLNSKENEKATVTPLKATKSQDKIDVKTIAVLQKSEVITDKVVPVPATSEKDCTSKLIIEEVVTNSKIVESAIKETESPKALEVLTVIESKNIPSINNESETNKPDTVQENNVKCEKKVESLPITVVNLEVPEPSRPEIAKPPTPKRPVKEEAAVRPLIATPRNLQKKVPQIIHSSSSSSSSSEEESSEDEDADESDASEGSTEFFECENHPDGRTSTGSNDSGFDSSAPTSPAGFLHIKKDCDVNCHWKCEKLTANLCGVNQRLLVEALASRTASKRGGETAGTSGKAPVPGDTADLVEHELEQSTAYGLFRRTGRFTPPARSIPRFRKYNIEDFHFIKVLGKGSFGKVMLAELRDTEYYYAVKCLKKDVVLEDDDVECTLIERKVLALGTNHPYLCHLFATFQTDCHLFFVMEYLNGGDLMFHIQQSGRFPEARARFYAAEIVSGLKFLHKRGIVYRDLKLDNILLDFDGHVRIADFGMCKLQIYLDKTADTFCGTPDYMAPEIIKGLKYNQTVDWWSFGVLLYEMLIGQSPFSGCDEDELFWSICNEIPSYPRFLSTESLTILTRLLDKDMTTRLGGTECMHGDVRDQDFFHAIHWDRLESRELDAPFRPRVRHPLDTQYFDRAFTGERPRLTAVEPQVLRSMDQAPFRGFSYTNPNATDR